LILDSAHVPTPGQSHRQGELLVQCIEHLRYARLAINCQAKEHWAPYEDRVSSQSKRFKNVRASSNSTVDKNGNLLT
jgi:hypothetical protein